ncbi:putative phage abortive infection protein [Flavobacterium wongokense]|uniref:putative phage abortive infection protein n=1 Tax=Flavobacterium wongokense TaxID=2910674 RepID=UPI001F1B0C00|nr:putative phage abortive infection protein [Flavobacterium sp. WG47]MCF6130890.1 putative phage abortive infection protein [Flavobacterium sp. WG47]
MATNVLIFCFILILLIIGIIGLMIKETLDSLKSKKSERSIIINVLLTLSIVLLLFSFFAPYFFTNTSIGKSIITGDATGLIGDTMGGVMNPFIAIAAALLTFLAFWIQYKANEQQKKDLRIERFENKFYELLKIHRDNVNEVAIGQTLTGRKAFISMFNELKFTYYVVNKFTHFYNSLNRQHPINDDIAYNVSYLIFFFGIGKNSSMIVKDLLGEDYDEYFGAVERQISIYQLFWEIERDCKRDLEITTDQEEIFTLDLRYKPCNGQMSKLSHYVRHLFQLVKFVDDAEDNIFSYDQKYDYIASIRSQLSAHEQLLLFYNAVSVLGKPWIDNNYLKTYCVVKSCPLPLANFYTMPRELLGDENQYGRVMFEWGDIKNRMQSEVN